VIRCRKCRAFGSKFARLGSQQRWVCPICSRENTADAGRDLSTTPELQHSLYELRASETFVLFLNVKPRFLFCVDISSEAWECGFTNRVLRSIAGSISGLSDATEFGLIVFDSSVSVFCPSKKRFFVVADAENPCCPLYGGSLFTSNKECMVEAVEVVLGWRVHRSGQCLGAAAAIASGICAELCAVVVLCGFGLPSVGAGKLSLRDYEGILGTAEEAGLLRLPSGDPFYRDLALGESGASFHLFIAARGFVDVAALGFAPSLTSGRICHLPDYDDKFDGDFLSAELHRTMTSHYLWDCVLAFHSPTAIKLCKLHAMTVPKQRWTFFPTLSAEQSLSFEIDLAREISSTIVCGATLIYTDSQGERIIRSLAFELSPTRDRALLATVDPIAVTMMTVKNGCRVILTTHPSAALITFKRFLFDAFRMFPLGFPTRLLPYAHFCYCLKQSIVFDTQPGVDVDARMASLLNLKGMNSIDILLWLHPRIIPLAFPDATLPLITPVLSAYPICVIHMVDRIFVWVGENADSGDIAQLFGGEVTAQIPQLETATNFAVRRIIDNCWALSARYLPVSVIRPGDRRVALIMRYLMESDDVKNTPYEAWYNGMYGVLSRRYTPGRGR
jgi:hypothetical protein